MSIFYTQWAKKGRKHLGENILHNFWQNKQEFVGGILAIYMTNSHLLFAASLAKKSIVSFVFKV